MEQLAKLSNKQGFDFTDIDWSYFFREEFRHGYSSSNRFDKFLQFDGIYDIEKLKASGQKIDFSDFLKSDGNVDLDSILIYLSDYTNYYEKFLFFAKGRTFREEQKEKIRKALLESAEKMLKIGKIPNLFEWMESVFPIFFDTFEIIIKSLPKILQPEIAINTPPVMSCTKQEAFNYFIKNGYGQEQAKELAEQFKQYQDAVFFFREIYSRKLPLKDGKKWVSLGETISYKLATTIE